MSTAYAHRIRATPYARRLARERNLSLAAIVGSGPNGRITGDDLKNHRPPDESSAPSKPAAEGAPSAAPLDQIAVAAPALEGVSAAPTAKRGATVAGAAPSAIVATVQFAALDNLLTQIAAVREGVERQDICLKAAAVALRTMAPTGDRDGILLVVSDGTQKLLTGLADASVSTIAELREATGGTGTAALAVSFIGRAGVRPVSARLRDGIAARLVIGAAGNDASADCLLSYEPAQIADDAAEDFLVAFRDLVETPFRLLV